MRQYETEANVLRNLNAGVTATKNSKEIVEKTQMEILVVTRRNTAANRGALQ